VLRERKVKAAKAKPDPRAKELEKALKMLETKVCGIFSITLFQSRPRVLQKHQLAAARALLTKGKKVTPAPKQLLREEEDDAGEPERTGPVRRGAVCAEPVRGHKEPVRRERARAEPVREEPADEEPVREESVRVRRGRKEPVVDETADEELVREEPVRVRRGRKEPVVEEPVVERHSGNVPVPQQQTFSQPGLYTFEQVQELFLLRQPSQQPAVMVPSHYGQTDPYRQPYLEQVHAMLRPPYAPVQFAAPLTRAPPPFDMPRMATSSTQGRGLFQPSPSHRQADPRYLQQQLFAQNDIRDCYPFFQHSNPFAAPTRPRSTQGYTGYVEPRVTQGHTGYIESPAPRQHFMDEYQY